MYGMCKSCPRECNIDRDNGKKGFCNSTDAIKLAWCGLHFGEEPPVTGKGGSGAIFVSGCNLRCTYCQNYQISQLGMGKEVSEDEFVRLCLLLQEKGAENINIITGSHAVEAICEGLNRARQKGLSIPICWNSSSYEKTETLEKISTLADIWLPDLKTLNPIMSKELFDAEDYPSVAKKAIRWMVNNHPLVMKDDKMVSGVIVRHLVLPGRIDDSRLFFEWAAKHLKNKALISVMTQYTPVRFDEKEKAKREKSLSSFQNRYLSEKEFDEITKMIEEYDIPGFYQELVQDSEWLPDFNNRSPFDSKLATTVWHWND